LDRHPLAENVGLVLAFTIVYIHWQKLLMHKMFIFGRVPLAKYSVISTPFCPVAVTALVRLNFRIFV